jgi:hypothetical protein
MGGTAPWTECARVAALIEHWLDQGWTRTQIRARTGIAERRLWGILRREQEVVGFDTLDALLTGMDETDRWFTDFADVYEQLAPTT